MPLLSRMNESERNRWTAGIREEFESLCQRVNALAAAVQQSSPGVEPARKERVTYLQSLVRKARQSFAAVERADAKAWPDLATVSKQVVEELRAEVAKEEQETGQG